MPCSLIPVKNFTVLGSSAVTPTLLGFPLWMRKQSADTGLGMSNLKIWMSFSFCCGSVGDDDDDDDVDVDELVSV